MVRRLDCRQPDTRSSPVSLAVSAARRHELVVFPTETAYAVACDAFSPEAVDRLNRAKGRSGATALPVMVGSVRGLEGLAAQVTPEEKALVAGFWPGPLTVVCKTQPSLAWDLGGSGETVSLRMPLHPLALEVLAGVGPMAVVTANRAGAPAPVDCDEAVEQMGEAVSLYLDGGPCTPGPPSTIVDLTRPRARLVREGALPATQLAEWLPSLAAAEEEAPA